MNATHPVSRKTFSLTAAILLLAVAGCHKKGIDSNIGTMAGAPSSTGTAPTAVITAEPLAVDLGQSVVLNWRTKGADTVSIDGIGSVNVNGTRTVAPSNSTNFHLTAKSADGTTTEANVRVTVRVPVAPSIPAADANAAEGDMGSEAAFHQNVQDLFFGYDSYELDAVAQSNAAHAAAYLASHPAIKVIIGGYCDERGSAEYNLALGENRANAAKTALVNAGVPAGRLRVVSFGKEKQFCTEEDESCYQKNRRAQFSLDR